MTELVGQAVNTLTGDCRQMGKPFWYTINNKWSWCQLSLLSLLGRWIQCQPLARVKVQHIHLRLLS